MEITNEIKSKVFAQYLGQRISIPKVKGSKNHWFCTPSTVMNIEVDLLDYKGTVLILKPLSAITDEDAIEVQKMYGLNIEEKSPYFLEVLSSYEQSWQIFQFLQSQGYDLPNYLLGGKTLFDSALCIYDYN